MEQIIEPLHDYLSVKSQARLRSVSKFFIRTVVVKNYSFYEKYKKIKEYIYPEYILNVLFKTDIDYIEREKYYTTFYPIEFHLYGKEIKKYIISSKWYWCVIDFAQIICENDSDNFILIDEICNHCQYYADNRPLQSVLIQLCYEEYKLPIFI